MEASMPEGNPQGCQNASSPDTPGGPWRYMSMYGLGPHLSPQATTGAETAAVADLAVTLAADKQTFLPSNLPSDPRHWSFPQVCHWLDWCVQHFSLPPINLDNFHMNGLALCLLTKSDFKERFPRAGDVLFNCLHILVFRAIPAPNVSNLLLGQATANAADRAQPGSANLQHLWSRSVSSDFHSIGYMIQEHTSSADMDSTVILSPAPSTEGASDKSGAEGKGPAENILQIGSGSEEEEEQQQLQQQLQQQHVKLVQHQQAPSADKDSSYRMPSLLQLSSGQQPLAQMDYPQEKSVRLLWDFLQQLLNDPGQRYKRCIAWKEKCKGVFKIVDPHQLAYLWGMQKNHLNMNFDKMSRALRYYYRVKILQKEPGERHCYRFLRHPMELRNCKQRSLLSNKEEMVNSLSSVESEGVLNMSVKDEWPPELESE